MSQERVPVIFFKFNNSVEHLLILIISGIQLYKET